MVHFVKFFTKKLHALKELRKKKLSLAKTLPCETRKKIPTSTLLYSITETQFDPIVFPSPNLCTSLFFVDAWQSNPTPLFLGTQDVKRCVISATLEMYDTKTLNQRTISQKNFSCGVPCITASKVSTTDRKIAVAVKYIIKETSDASIIEKRTIQREIYYHIFLLIQLKKLKKENLNHSLLQEKRGIFGTSLVPFSSPVVDLLGYYVNVKEPQRCIIITALIFGVDLSQWMVLEKDVIIQNYQHTRFTSIVCPKSLAFVRLWIALLILRRVFYLHHLGLRHNDLKPSNIMIDLFNCSENKTNALNNFKVTAFHTLNHFTHYPNCQNLLSLNVKLIDLGNATSLYSKKQCGGTFAYTSPEQMMIVYNMKKSQSKKQHNMFSIDHRSDLWALGLILVELMTGVSLNKIFEKKPLLNSLTTHSLVKNQMTQPEVYIQWLYEGFFKTNHSITYTNNFLQNTAKKIFHSFIRKDPNSRKTIPYVMLLLLQCALEINGIQFERILQTYQNVEPIHVPVWIDAFFKNINRPYYNTPQTINSTQVATHTNYLLRLKTNLQSVTVKNFLLVTYLFNAAWNSLMNSFLRKKKTTRQFLISFIE